MTSRRFDPALHQRKLLALLLAIYKTGGTHPGPGDKLVFKGGTCAVLFHQLPRLSFDLDFDLLSPFDAGDTDTLRAVLAGQATVREARDKRNTLFHLLNYEKGAPNIKVEINKRIWTHNAHRNAWLLGVEVRIADEATLATNKLVALADRPIPVARDLFDAHFFLKMGFPLNEALVLERTGKPLRDYLGGLPAFVERRFRPRDILHGLGDALGESQKTWARERLIADFRSEIERRINPLDTPG